MENENKDLTGLTDMKFDNAEQREDTEKDLLTKLFELAEYKDSDEAILEIDLVRNKKVALTIKVRPIDDQQMKTIRKKATSYAPNPNGKRFPPIEKDFDTSKFNSLLIYTAATEEDKKNIWGEKRLMDKYGLIEPWETVDKLLLAAEKLEICNKIYEISGDDEDTTLEDYAKN